MDVIVDDAIEVQKVEITDNIEISTVMMNEDIELPNRIGINGRSPYIGENHTWWQYDDLAGQYVDTGIAATDEELRAKVLSIETTLEEIIEKDVIVEESSYLLFPLIGESKTIYIDSTTNQSYRWDTDNLKYYILNDESFEILDGGN